MNGDPLGDLILEMQQRFGIANDEPKELPAHVESYREFVNRVNPGYCFYWHNDILAEVAQKIADGELKRVMIWVPPGTGKSETVSRLLSAYYLYRHPAREVGLVSYGASLAEDLAGDAREYFIEAGGILSDSTQAKGDWKTTAGGGMWGKGFGGAIRGRRFHLGIVDDPHKGPEELESEKVCGKFHKWYLTTWLNRQNRFFVEGAAIVIVMQRMASNDLCGFLLENEVTREGWTIIALDAIKGAGSDIGELIQKNPDKPLSALVTEEENYDQVPESCTVWPDTRKPGELLCPEILPLSEMLQFLGDLDSFNAQFQQRPVPAAGEIFQKEWFAGKVIHPAQVPVLLKTVIGVDLAVTEKTTADFTVGFPMAWGVDGNYYLFNPYRAQSSAPDSQDGIIALAQKTKARVVAVESVAFQLSFVQYLRRDPRLVGIPVMGVEADRDKVARAKGWSPFAKGGQMFLVEDGTGWTKVFLAELLKFPKSKKKDQVDSVGIAFEAMRAAAGLPQTQVGGQARGTDHRLK